MRFAAFLARWEGLNAENRWSRGMIATLLVVLVLLTVKLFRKEIIVTLQPVTLTGEAWLMRNQASESYQEAWGLFLAQLLGNVTPGTVRFIQTRLKPLLAPRIYHEVMAALSVQSQQIQNHHVTLRFEPRTVDFEPETGKVFVYGYSFEKGAGSTERRVERTYEYRIQIAHYAPLIRHLDVYSGKPRTQKVLLLRRAQQITHEKRHHADE